MIRRPAIAILSACAALLPATAAAQTARPAAAPFEVTEASIETLQKAMTDGRITSLQLVDAYLARIRAYDHAGPALNTMIRLSPKARSDAAALDAERKAGKVRGPLHGVPIVVKDNYDTKDMITTAGSLALATHRPKTDAFVIQKLRDAGAVIVGKTNLHELASGITSISSLGGQTPRHAAAVAEHLSFQGSEWLLSLPPDLETLYTQSYRGYELAVVDG